MDNAGWWAAVVYKDGVRENVTVYKIREEEHVPAFGGKPKSKPFDPQHLLDFDKEKYYRTLTNKGLDKESYYYALIGKLAESEEGLSTGGRTRFAPNRTLDMREPETTSADEEDLSRPVLLQRTKRVSKKNNQRSAANEECAAYLSRNVLELDAPTSVNEQTDPKILEMERKLAEAQEKLAEANRENRKLVEANTENRKQQEDSCKHDISALQTFWVEKFGQLTEVLVSLKSEVVDLKKNLSKSDVGSNNWLLLEWIRNLPTPNPSPYDSDNLCSIFI